MTIIIYTYIAPFYTYRRYLRSYQFLFIPKSFSSAETFCRVQIELQDTLSTRVNIQPALRPFPCCSNVDMLIPPLGFHSVSWRYRFTIYGIKERIERMKERKVNPESLCLLCQLALFSGAYLSVLSDAFVAM